MRTRKADAASGYAAVSVTLFAALFAAQAAVIAMAPVLAEAASDLGVSTAAAGQLRTVTGLSAGATALGVSAVAARIPLGRLLIGASALLAAGALMSSAAPTFPLLVLAQLPIGVAVAVLTSVATLAAAEWSPPEVRTRVLSWALVGQPAAWIVGMPLVGVVGERSWRYGWLALPLVAAVASAFLARAHARGRSSAVRPAPLRAALGEAAIVRWLAAEVLANTGWAGTLVFSGALFTESYGSSPGLTGLLLSVAAVAYVVGNFLARRLAGRDARQVLRLLAAALAIVDGLFGVARVDAATSTALLATAATLAGARTLVSSLFAVSTPPELRPSVTGLRAATMQIGYFVGALIGGIALAAGGYGALGAAMGASFAGAAALLARNDAKERPRRRVLYRRTGRERNPQPIRTGLAAVTNAQRPKGDHQMNRKRELVRRMLPVVAVRRPVDDRELAGRLG
jgi:predicted MFS family arabinose efflux permease